MAASAAAQTGRVVGIVKDEAGQPIKGATLSLENPEASPRNFTATSDDRGRFAVIGLKAGEWSMVAQAPGFVAEVARLQVRATTPSAPMLTLRRAPAPPPSALGSVGAKDLQSELRSADQMFNAQQWDQAIASYKSILAKAPALSVINLQVGAAYRNKKDYDGALAAYNDLLKADPNSDKARVGVGQTYMEKGDLGAAANALNQAAQQGASKELLFTLGEIEAAQRQHGRSGQVVPEGVGRRSELGQAAAEAGADRHEQRRQNRCRRQDAARDHRRSDVGRSRAGKDRHRAVEIEVPRNSLSCPGLFDTHSSSCSSPWAPTLAAVGGWRYARASAPVPGPIILISVDTLRADHLPAYGYRNVTTPAIDSLARDGIVFERAYGHAVQTLPAHVALLSGRLPFDTGVRDDTAPLKASERLLAQMLSDRGYATAGIVSSGLLRREMGIAQGFDFFDDPSTSSDSPRAQSRGDEMPSAAAATELTVGELRRDGAESEAVAERWLSTVGSTRLFLFLHLHEPHAPYMPPERFDTLAPYDGAIAYADEILGRFIRFLKTNQLYDQSTIVLVSDHGEGLGDHGEQEHGLFVYDEAIHVPLIIKQAGGADAGRRVADLVQQADIVPDRARPRESAGPRKSSRTIAQGAGRRHGEAACGPDRLRGSLLREATLRVERARIADRRPISSTSAHRAKSSTISSAIRDSAKTSPERPARHRRCPQEVIVARRNALRRLLGEQSDARADAEPGADPADPKDRREISEQYRAALALRAERKWPQAIDLLQKVLRDEPDATGVWTQLAHIATLAERYPVALDAYQHVIALAPLDAGGLSGRGERLAQGAQARRGATARRTCSGGGSRRSAAACGSARGAGQYCAGPPRCRGGARRSPAGQRGRSRQPVAAVR